jgi:hypothetical protein
MSFAMWGLSLTMSDNLSVCEGCHSLCLISVCQSCHSSLSETWMLWPLSTITDNWMSGLFTILNCVFAHFYTILL